MMSFLKRWIVDEVVQRITSWNTTIVGAVVAYLTVILTQSGIFSPEDVHSIAGQTAQWVAAGVSIFLFALKDTVKYPPQDNTPTQPPEKDQ